MKTLRWFGAAAVLGLVAGPAVRAQEFQPPKPGPEHELLKKHEGTWDITMKFGGMETKGTSTYKMDLGGLWLSSRVESEIFGMKFQGFGMDSYDPMKKKYVAVWFDSMSTAPMTMEGTYDKDKKTMTMVGEGPGMDGKPTKHTAVSEWKDDDTIHFSMSVGDGKEPAFTIVYKRRK
jgi:Protein of unknown function (DUF1579)